MILFASIVAIVFGVVARDTKRERLLYGVKVFAEFIGIGLALAWLLYFLPL
jgi:undecaprenyl pyrophosphate phosphatase UppP